MDMMGEMVLVQPKLRGERAWVSWYDGYPHLISSYGNAFSFMEHIQDELAKLHPIFGPVPLDGELYVHGWTQEEINSVCNRTVNRHPDTEKMEYHIFDVKDIITPQGERCLFVYSLFFAQDSILDNPCKYVETFRTNSSNVIPLTQNFTDEGYEGIIVRNPKGLYQEKRTNNMLKYKPKEDDEYRILKLIEAISQTGEPKGMVGSFLVAGDDGTPFKVGAGKLKHSRRIELWETRKHQVGKMLLVKHEKLKTVNQVPLCCVAVEVALK